MNQSGGRSLPVACAFALVVMPPAASAQTDAVSAPDAGEPNIEAGVSPESQPAGLATGLAVEKIIVYAERPLRRLRQDLYEVEEAYYAAYNEANSNDEFDIVCKERSRTGTKMRFRVCEARFVRDLDEDYAEAFIRGQPLPTINASMRARGQLLIDDMRQVVRQNPEVFESLQRLAEMTRVFEEERERRCGILLCPRR